MNTKYIYLYLFSFILLFGACSDFLDTTPDNRAELDTEDKITSLLVSAYPTNTPILMAETASDNAMDNGSLFSYYPGVPEQEDAYLWRETNTAGNDTPLALWRGCYKSIAAANHVLQAIEEMGSPASLNPQRGEALLCRAYGHFVLVNFFSQAYNSVTSSSDMGIPYSVKPEDEVFVHYERGTVADTYAKINADIEEGLPLINDNIYTVPKYHFNSAAAYAFAARFNLYYWNFEKVIEYSTKALGDNPERVMRNWEGFLAASGAGDKGNAYINAAEPANLLLLPAYSSWPYVHSIWDAGRRYAHAREICDGETLWSPSPFRNYLLLGSLNGWTNQLVLVKLYMYFEYTDKTGRTGYRHMVNPAFTTNETLLCRAEAYAHTNQLDKAADDLAIWAQNYSTAGAPKITKEEIIDFYQGESYMPLEITSASQRSVKKHLNPKGITLTEGSDLENIIQCVLHFRRMDSLHEGLRWYDIKRYGIEIAHNREGLSDDILKVDDPRRAFQLPQDVIAAGLQANPR